MADILANRATTAAVALLGATITHRLNGEILGGVIVETEAYDQSDAASHSYRGKTQRNIAMFDGPGTAYVYRSYGLHWCLNVSCGPQGFGAAVLIRALRPTHGIYTQHKLRGLLDDVSAPSTVARLCRGPGNLTCALGIHADNNQADLLDPKSSLRIEPAGIHAPSVADVRMSPRIGIRRNAQVPWRFFLANERCVSATKKGAAVVVKTGLT